MGVHGSPRKSYGTPRLSMDVITDADGSLHGHSGPPGSSMEVPWKQSKSVELRGGPPRNNHGTFMEPTSAEVSMEIFSE